MNNKQKQLFSIFSKQKKIPKKINIIETESVNDPDDPPAPLFLKTLPVSY